MIELDQAVIQVASDGERYTAVLNSSPPITGVMRMTLNAHRDGFVRRWKLWSSIQAENMPKEQFPDLNYSKNYKLSERIKKVRRELPFSIPRQAYKAYAEEACNELAKDLQLLHGKTDAEIFAEDRSIAVEAGAEVSWDMSGIAEANPPLTEVSGGGQPNPKIKTVTILCLKTPPAPPKVNGAAVFVQGIDPVNSQGNCRMRLGGSLISNLPNVDGISFRYVDDKGNQSDLKTVNTGADRWASFEHEYPLNRGQKRDAKIRIVGENFDFASPWKDFEYECEDKPIGSLTTELPPEATSLNYFVKEEVVRHGMVCPSAITVFGVVKGRGGSSGTVTLGADGNQIAEKPFKFIGDESKSFAAQHQISWKRKARLKQDVPLTLRIHGLKPADNGAGENSLGPLQGGLQKMVTVECREPALPELTLSVRVGERKLYQGYMCPESVPLRASLRGQEDFDGRTTFIVRQQPSLFEAQSQVKEFNFAITDGERLLFDFAPEVRWSNVPQNGDAPPKQTLDVTVQIVRAGAVVDTTERSVEVNCTGVSIPNVGISFDPPKAINLQVVPTTDEVLYQGQICPASVEVMGAFLGQGVASGNALLGANGSFLTQESFSIDDGDVGTVRGEHTLNWVGVEGPFQQDVDVVLHLIDPLGTEVGRLAKTQTIECRKPQLANATRDRADALSIGNPSVTHGQQAGKPATPGNGAAAQLALQAGPAFAVQAPKGQVREGRIQLSGGAANAKYDLRFYRGDKGGYRSVRSAQLPRQMTGRAARFSLRALSGGLDWRIEVCPAGSKSKAACKTSDFRILQSGSVGKVKTPGTQGDAKVFIMPGSGS
ncbi:hypothetical protein [Pelagibius sp.]|uniref:hypothetical protein n=1 Tax=Pelagibius sp. TaxID=1931238 RepID=UPI003B5090EB